MIGEYLGALVKTEFECSHGHRWMAMPKNVKNNGTGCPKCDQDTKRKSEDINDELVGMGLRMIGYYPTNNKTKTLFECNAKHTWMATPNNILAGYGCPYCANHGFNPNKSAWEYAFMRDGYIKFGITNDLNRRLTEHRRHGEFTLIHERHHEVGQLALDWENNIKRTHGGRYVTKEQCPDGYTETLCISKLEQILESSR